MKKRVWFYLGILLVIATIITGVYTLSSLTTSPQKSNNATYQRAKPPQKVPKSSTTTSHTPQMSYEGEEVTIANLFRVKVPNGWSASISESTGFTAIMFASPEHLDTLKYTPDVKPSIGQGIASWSGLTEHFFILYSRASAQNFQPSEHQEITSTSFKFTDKTIGTKYHVIKHASEAQKWNGLLRDDRWEGRTYIYSNDDVRIEAHLALYPSSTVNVNFFEKVIETIRSN